MRKTLLEAVHSGKTLSISFTMSQNDAVDCCRFVHVFVPAHEKTVDVIHDGNLDNWQYFCSVAMNSRVNCNGLDT